MTELSEPVRRFLDVHIDSVPHLECLLLLCREPRKDWTLTELSQRLYLPLEATRLIVADLVRQTLVVELPASSEAAFRYQPEPPEVSAVIDLVCEAYRSHLTAMTNLIHTKASRPVLEFARAFRVSKEKK